MKTCKSLKDEDVIVDDEQLRNQTYLVEDTSVESSWIVIGAKNKKEAKEMAIESHYGKPIEYIPENVEGLNTNNLIATEHLPVVQKNRSDIEKRYTELVKALNEAELTEKVYEELKAKIE